MNQRKSLSTVDVHPSLTLAQVREAGVFAGGGPVALDVRGLRVVVSVRHHHPQASLRLEWLRPCGGRSGQSFRLEPRPLPFGGSAWWLACSCGARATALYLNEAGDTWGFRSCLRLNYPSQHIRYPGREPVE